MSFDLAKVKLEFGGEARGAAALAEGAAQDRLRTRLEIIKLFKTEG